MGAAPWPWAGISPRKPIEPKNMKVTIDIINPPANSIYSVLKAKLGREPSNDELRAEIKRILAGK